MADIFKNICKTLSIELSYTNNKVTILSCNCRNSHPSIRAHKIFKECNEITVYAIIDYYAKAEKQEENLKIIKDYADKKFNLKAYKIATPNSEFCSAVLKNMVPLNSNQSKEADLIELTISSMTKKDFYGDAHTVNPNETLKVNKGDLLEVDITVDPFNT